MRSNTLPVISLVHYQQNYKFVLMSMHHQASHFFFIFLVHKCLSSLKDLVCFIREYLFSIIICDIKTRQDWYNNNDDLPADDPLMCGSGRGGGQVSRPPPLGNYSLFNLHIKIIAKICLRLLQLWQIQLSFGPPTPFGKNFWIRAVWNTWSPFDSSWLETNSP